MELNITAFELHLSRAFGFLPEQYKELLGDDWEHFDVDSVKLIETGPSTGRGEAFEEFTHHNEVHGVGAVEDDTLFGKGFGKILGGLGFTGTCRSGWSTSQIEFKSSHEGHITFISQGRNDQSESVS